MLPQYLAYYRPDFHPAQRDSTALRNKGLLLLKQYLGDKIALAA
jgi:predicted metal-dependent hydrolase